MVPGPLPILAVVLVGLTPILISHRLNGWAFTFVGASIALVVLTLFLNLYPRVLVSSTSNAFSLTITQSSSTPYTLTVMTIVAAIFVPVVLLYTAWTYWVFRQRLTRDQFELPRLLQKKPPRRPPRRLEQVHAAPPCRDVGPARRHRVAACATLQSACVVVGAAALATAISGVFAHGDDLAREAVPVAVFGSRARASLAPRLAGRGERSCRGGRRRR